jgi:hypothetical protein
MQSCKCLLVIRRSHFASVLRLHGCALSACSLLLRCMLRLTFRLDPEVNVLSIPCLSLRSET